MIRKKALRLLVRREVAADDGIMHVRPEVRGDCANGIRPCPFVSCSMNTYLDVTATGALMINRPVEPEEIPPEQSCALDMAETGPHTLGEIGAIVGLVRERVRQIEAKALQRLGRQIRRMDEDLTPADVLAVISRRGATFEEENADSGPHPG